MITEQYKDKVYFSKLLSADYPRIYKEVCDILDANNVAHDTLPFTRDYWCRDYMPIQRACSRYVQFTYNPDYLQEKKKYITNTDDVIAKMNFPNIGNNIVHSNLIIDGGNLVVCELDSLHAILVMTDKVMEENHKLSKEEIEQEIKQLFGEPEYIVKILWLPWDTKDICGHTDGILRFVGKHKNGKLIVLANLSVYDDDIAGRMRALLKEHFEVKELDLSEYNDLSWAYINALQTRDVIIVPGIGDEKLDKEALAQFFALYPQYKGRIYQVQMKNFIKKWNGALNCCTWTISEDMSTVIHNKEKDAKYNAIIEKYKDNTFGISREEIDFLGDYYPRRLEYINREWDKIYWGF